MAHVPKLDRGDAAARLKITAPALLAWEGPGTARLMTAARAREAFESPRHAHPSFRLLQPAAVGPFVDIFDGLFVARALRERQLLARTFGFFRLVRHCAPPSSNSLPVDEIKINPLERSCKLLILLHNFTKLASTAK
jgi:hypothetical protein